MMTLTWILIGRHSFADRIGAQSAQSLWGCTPATIRLSPLRLNLSLAWGRDLLMKIYRCESGTWL